MKTAQILEGQGTVVVSGSAAAPFGATNRFVVRDETSIVRFTFRK
jgi:hypothetical protein